MALSMLVSVLVAIGKRLSIILGIWITMVVLAVLQLIGVF